MEDGRAGRKHGSGSKKRSAAILKRAFDEGIMPLEVMLSEMRRCYNDDTEESLKEARMLAQAAAPYCHPRLQANMSQTTLQAGDTLSELLRAIDGNHNRNSRTAQRRWGIGAGG